jgi:hypothetical protein
VKPSYKADGSMVDWSLEIGCKFLMNIMAQMFEEIKDTI